MNAITLRGLLQRDDLSLQLVSAVSADSSASLDRPLRWGYSTDLLDPTPFLRGRELILTTGQQLWAASGDVAQITHDYVARIAQGGAAGLVYTLEQPNGRWEAMLRRSCVEFGMPLLEAPFSTPFIGISEAISSGRSDPEREGMRRVLHAQHALTLAALERVPAQALVRELSLLLDCTVWLWGADARVLGAAPVEDPAEWVGAVVRERLRAGQRRRQAGREVHDGQDLAIHLLTTAGPTAALGALTLLRPAARRRTGLSARGAQRDERDDRMIVNSAVAMLQLALTARPAGALEHDEVAEFGLRALLNDDAATGWALLQRSLLGEASDQSRWQLLCSAEAPSVHGEPAVSTRLAERGVWVTLAAVVPGDDQDAMVRRLLHGSAVSEGAGAGHSGASRREAANRRAVAIDLPRLSAAAAGVSAESLGEERADSLSGALSVVLWRWKTAAPVSSAVPGEPMIERIDTDQMAVLRALAEEPAAAAVLRDISTAVHAADTDAREADLARTFVVWCDSSHSWQQAAQRLGVHRNTVVRRVRALAEALGRDLEYDAAVARLVRLALALEPLQQSAGSGAMSNDAAL
ncbi:PucR family transcriptional regulator [Pseudoclavibacter sp. 13-3]|uniref:PucR family transcriptional regulator n=1 Tax=Pseudoclavibacter sp. 13-3 TaxID=2901228 RepID=UPI001E4BC180|nr:PucR family transcriptional regulator [Pseudoclavibacter sp. 13-3]MCD7101322.1 PucR family transcriptional regulator [Pseudoclavibacter sp. 13-3]